MCKLGGILLKSSSLVSYAHSILRMAGQIPPSSTQASDIFSLQYLEILQLFSLISACSWEGTCHTVVLCPISVPDYPAHLETLVKLWDQEVEVGERFCSTSGFCNIYRQYLHKKVRETKIHNKKGRQCCIVERACTLESAQLSAQLRRFIFVHICAQTS